MNETSIHGMKRTHMCGDLRLSDAGQTVTVNGWVDRVRDNGGVLFLLSKEAASFITGVVLPIDGGFSAYSGV